MLKSESSILILNKLYIEMFIFQHSLKLLRNDYSFLFVLHTNIYIRQNSISSI